MPKRLIKKITEKKETKKVTTPKVKKQVSDVKKLKMLITVVDRSKALFYVDLLEQFEVNVQMVIYGRGTANSEMLNLLGIAESDKAVIMSNIREDKVKNGKGIAYTISLDSIIGVSMYQLLSNDRTLKEGGKK